MMFYEFVYEKDSGIVRGVTIRQSGEPPLKLTHEELQRGLRVYSVSSTAGVPLKTKTLRIPEGETEPAFEIANPTRSIIRRTILPVDVKQIAFVRTHDSIGDLVSIVSAIQSARKQRPSARIIVQAPMPARSILENHRDIDELREIEDELPQEKNSVIIDLSHPCPCGEYESAMKEHIDKSRNEIFTIAAGLEWRSERPKLYLTPTEVRRGLEIVSGAPTRADYHVHVAEEDSKCEPAKWVEAARRKRLGIVGVVTHGNYSKSKKLAKILNRESRGKPKFVPVVEITISDSSRRFHLLCVNPKREVSDTRIESLHELRAINEKLVLAHPGFDFNDFASLLDGAEIENGRHKCKRLNSSLAGFKGSDAHRLDEWAKCLLFTEERVMRNNRPNVGVCLRSAEIWKDWPHVLDFVNLAKSYYNVFVFDETRQVAGATNIVGHPIRDVMAALVYMDCVISPDTSIHHLCEALQVPCIALFGSMNVQRYEKRGYDCSVDYLQGRCRYRKAPCMYQVCAGRGNYQPCMEWFTPEFVLQKVKEKLFYGTTAKDRDLFSDSVWR